MLKAVPFGQMPCINKSNTYSNNPLLYNIGGIVRERIGGADDVLGRGVKKKMKP